jgi:acyl-CoA synthetase (AMP-forming)/AMP-acid ligase II
MPVSHGINDPASSREAAPLCIRPLLQWRAEQSPEAIALTAPGRRPLTYRRLWEQIDVLLSTLRSFGIGRGDRVALVLPNGPEMALAFLGTACAETCAPLNPAYTASELDFYLLDLRAKAVIVPQSPESPAIDVARARGLVILRLTHVDEAEAGVFTLTGEPPAARCDSRSAAEQPEFPQPDDVALVMHTSGTTSRPKVVPLSQSNLCASAANIRVAYELDERDRCLNVMPLFHAQGLMVTLSTVLSGGSVICTPGFDPDRFPAWIDEFRPTWYSAAPTIHQAILTHAARYRGVLSRCPLRFIRSSAAPLPPQVLAELERVFRAPVIEGYGMTESALHVTSNPLPPGRRKPGSVGIAVGTEAAIIDEAGNRLPPDTPGEVIFRGPNVVRAYENNPEANRSAFIDGWLRTGDLGYLDRDGYLTITGRLKEMINRGGEKISPREVDEVILDHPAVAQVVTFAIPHRTLGEDIAAAVVLKSGVHGFRHSNRDGQDGQDRTSGAFLFGHPVDPVHPCELSGTPESLRQEIRQFAATRLAHFKVPRVVLFLDELPKGPSGKVQRVGLAEKLGLTDCRSDPPPVRNPRSAICNRSPRTPVETMVAGIWCEVLGLPEVDIHDDFIAVGGHSLLATQVVSRVRKLFNVDLPLPGFFAAPTVAGLAEAITQGLAERSDRLEISGLLAELDAYSDGEA